jgi:hypothetical protein
VFTAVHGSPVDIPTPDGIADAYLTPRTPMVRTPRSSSIWMPLAYARI